MKTNCQDIQALLDRFILDELSDFESKILQEHLDHCAQCQKVIEGEAWEQHLIHLPKRSCPGRVIRNIETFIHSDKKKMRTMRLLHWHWRQTVIAGLAATAILAVLILHPIKEPQKTDQPQYTDAEIEQAREAMKWTMVYTAQKMKESESQVIDEVFTKHLPETLQKSVRKVLPVLQGGQQ